MSLKNLDKITRLAELKIEIDSKPLNSMPALSLNEEFNSIYRELENRIPHVHQSEIAELINIEIQNIETKGNKWRNKTRVEY